MKKVSVIVPVYEVEDYLERCLNSLVNQTLEDIEILIINDGSPDNSQSIIDKYKEKYSEKIISISIENQGVANARNLGLDHASGEYVGFVDSDDFVELSMFEDLYKKAKEEKSDVVVSGFTKLYTASSRNFQLGDTDLYGKSLRESPGILVAGVPYLWNKIFKRELIEKNRLRFHNFRIFEDLLFSYECYFYAECISKYDRPLYFYRARRQGSATNSFNERFFDIFQVMNILIDIAKKTGQFDILEEYLTYTALNHMIIRWETKVKEEELDKKERFFKESFNYIEKEFPSYKNHSLYFERYPEKNQKKYFSKRYWKKRFEEDIIFPKAPATRSQQIIKIVKNRFNQKKKSLINILSSKNANSAYTYLTFVKTLPVNEKIILFDPQHGEDANGNIFYLLKEVCFNTHFEGFNFYIAVEKSKETEFRTKLEFYNIDRVQLLRYESTDFLQVLATAKYLFSDTSLPTYFLKRQEQVYLNTWHGTPFKTLGRSSHDEMHRIGNLQRNFRIADYILYPSEYMKNHMLEDFMLDNISKNQIIMSGYPRNTVFFDEQNQKIRDKEQMNGMQVIAYLPTWRGSLNNAEGEDEIVGYLRQMDELIEENQLCYVNLHPYLKGSIDFSTFKNLRLIPSQYETYDFLNCCDVLITDYSSVFFDFANTRKKIVLFAYDEEEYFRDRGVYFDFAELPFPKVSTVPELMEAIKAPISYDDSKFLQQFCPYDDKDATEKLCERIILGKINDLTIEDVPNNGKENVLIFVGSLRNNLLTDQLFNSLQEMDLTDRNYFLTFRSWKVRRNKNILRIVPQNIKYISQLGTMSVSDKERIYAEKSANVREFYHRHQKELDRIFIDEKERLFGHTKIDKVIYYGAMDRNQMAILGKIQCKKLIYIPNMKFEKIPISPVIFDMYDEILVGDEEVGQMIVKHYNQKRIKVVGSKEEILRF